MDGMDGMDGDSMGGSTQMVPLSADGVDFTNATQATDFLGDLLDDTILQVIGNDYAQYFWYGVVVVIGIAAVLNFFTILLHRSRLVAFEGHQTSW